MSQEPSVVCTEAETEDWLAMELDEEKGCRLVAVVWCEANARPILSVALIGLASMVLVAMVFG